MNCPTKICPLLIWFLCAALPASAQTKAQSEQKAGDCSVNVNGNGNTASLVCNAIDATIAKQIQEILKDSHNNQIAATDISEKLDQIINHFNQEAVPPEVGLRFVYSTDPALVIVNQSSVVAHDIKWAVELWNMDQPDRDDPLPIPTSTFDWLRPHDEGGPQNLFDTPTVKPLLKSGDRLFGSASVSCPTCSRGRTYVVYIVYGVGGWFSELENEQSGRFLSPPNFHREFREKYFVALEAAVPVEKRIPISPVPAP
jgi:hypothetical protein